MKAISSLLIAFGWAALGCTVQAQIIVSITAPDSAAAEMWPGQTPNPASIRITRTGSTANTLAVWVKVSGTAVRGVDYSFGGTVGSFVTIPAGNDHLDIPVNVLDDAVTEATETIRIDLDDNTSSGSAVPYGIGNDDRAEVSIADNDDPNVPPRAVVSVAALQSAAEGLNGAPGFGAFRMTRTVNLNVDVTVAYSVGGSARSGEDYEALPGSVMIPAGTSFADVAIVPVDDAIYEGSESVTLTILASSCPGIFPPPPECYIVDSPASASVAILDNGLPPPKPTITLSVRQDTNVYGFPAAVNGLLTAVAPTGHIAFYEVRLDGELKFSGSTGFAEPPAAGTPLEFAFSMTNLTGGSHLVQATVTDNHGLSSTTNRTLFIVAVQPPRPPPATYSIVALDSEAAETSSGETSRPARFRFVRAGTPGELEFFSYSFTGSAREGVDYTVSYGPATYATNGVTNILSQEITIHPLDDVLLEGTETVKMQLCFPIIVIIYGVGAPIGVSCTGDVPGLNATINILDNDTVPPPYPVVGVAASDADAQEVSPLSGAPQNPGAFTIMRSAPATNDLIVNYVLSSPGTTPVQTASRKAQNGVDYEALPGVAVIPAGALNATIALNPIFDTWVEGSEVATLTLLPATNSPTAYLLDPGVDNFATVTIRDYSPTNIPIVRIKVVDSQAIEQPSISPYASFRVERSGSVAEAFTIPYAIGGTASNGLDYVALPGVVTLPVGASYAAITVIPYLDGETNEPDETVVLTLLSPPSDIFPPSYLLGGNGPLTASAGATIREDAPPPSRPLDRLERALRLRFPSRYRIVPLPVLPVVDPGQPAPLKVWAVEASNDLHAWQEIGETEDSEEFVDVNPGDSAQRFYRFREILPIGP